jgi:hypothetical protein
MCAIFSVGSEIIQVRKHTHTRSYRDASISFMNRRKIRPTDRGGKTFHTTDGLLIGHSIVSLDLAKKKEKTIDRIPDFIFLFSPFKKFIFTLRKDQKEQMDEKRPSSFFFPSFLVTHSKKTFSPPLFLTFLRPLFFLLPPKKLKHFFKTTF